MRHAALSGCLSVASWLDGKAAAPKVDKIISLLIYLLLSMGSILVFAAQKELEDHRPDLAM